MKYRKDFVTNSSSSSFLISKDQITHGHLLDILLEIANKEAEYSLGNTNEYDWSDVTGDCVAYRYNIRETTPEYAYRNYMTGKVYENHYSIDNQECGRYNWTAVDEVLKKHNIKYEKGCCD